MAAMASIPMAQQLCSCCRGCGTCPGDNEHKEVFWRLVLNALPIAARMPPACWQRPPALRLRSSPPPPRPPPPLMGLPSGGCGHHQPVCPGASPPSTSGWRRCPEAPMMACRQTASHTPARRPRRQLAAGSCGSHGRRQAADEGSTAGQRLAVARLWDLFQDFCSVGAAPRLRARGGARAA